MRPGIQPASPAGRTCHSTASGAGTPMPVSGGGPSTAGLGSVTAIVERD